MNRRLRILLHWLRGNRNGVRPGALVKALLSPRCGPKAARVIESETDVGDGLLCVRIAGVARPLYFPQDVSRFSLEQVLAECLYPDDWHFYETAETRVVSDDIVVDAGAAEGLFSLLVCDRCRSVFAVEPLPSFVRAMERTFADADNVEILPFALGAEPAEAVISANGAASHVGAAGPGDRVQVETIDRLFLDRGVPFTYLKADVEGWELELLEGARRSIAAYLPKIAIATYHRSDHADGITAMLRGIDLRYRIVTRGIEERAGSPVMLHAWVDASVPRTAYGDADTREDFNG